MKNIFGMYRVFINICFQSIGALYISILLLCVYPFYCLKNFNLLKIWYFYKILVPQGLLTLYLKALYNYKNERYLKSIKYLTVIQIKLEKSFNNYRKSLTRLHKAIYANIYSFKAKSYFQLANIDLGLDTIIKGCKFLNLSSLPAFLDLNFKKAYITKILLEAGELLKDKVEVETATAILIHANSSNANISKISNIKRFTKHKTDVSLDMTSSQHKCKIIPFPNKNIKIENNLE